MEAIVKNPIGFIQVTTVITSFFNVYFIGTEYQKENTLDLVYFIIVITLFVILLLWTLGIVLLGKRLKSCLPVVGSEMGINAASSILYLGGVICYCISDGREDVMGYIQSGKIISMILGFVNFLLYASGSFLIFIHDGEYSDKSDKPKPSKSLDFVQVSVLIVGICNIYFVSSEYKKDATLDLIYFAVVITLFLFSLLWALGNALIGKRMRFCLMGEVIYYATASLLYFGGVICSIVSISKEEEGEDYYWRGGKIISSTLGFLSVILYASGSILTVGYIWEIRDESNA